MWSWQPRSWECVPVPIGPIPLLLAPPAGESGACKGSPRMHNQVKVGMHWLQCPKKPPQGGSQRYAALRLAKVTYALLRKGLLRGNRLADKRHLYWNSGLGWLTNLAALHVLPSGGSPKGMLHWSVLKRILTQGHLQSKVTRLQVAPTTKQASFLHSVEHFLPVSLPSALPSLHPQKTQAALHSHPLSPANQDQSEPRAANKKHPPCNFKSTGVLGVRWSVTSSCHC